MMCYRSPDAFLTFTLTRDMTQTAHPLLKQLAALEAAHTIAHLQIVTP